MAINSKTLICFALPEESVPFRRLPAASSVEILVTGMGQRNAENALRRFLETATPPRVFTCGYAGGLNPALKAGEVLFETSDATLSEKLAAACASPAKFHCSSRIAATASEKEALRRSTGADAVEMESAVIHVVCRERGILCATVRAISDTAHEDMPLDFNALTNADQSLNYFKLAWAIAKSPGKIPALLRLQSHCRLAAANLAEVLAKVVS